MGGPLRLSVTAGVQMVSVLCRYLCGSEISGFALRRTWIKVTKRPAYMLDGQERQTWVTTYRNRKLPIIQVRLHSRNLLGSY